MLSGRASSCSVALGDGPDFLDFAVNQLSVDDESEFMFPVVEDSKVGDRLVNANCLDETKKEIKRLENRANQNVATQQHGEEHENYSTEELRTESKKVKSFGSNERKSSTDEKLIPSSRQGKTSDKESNKGQTIETSELKILQKRIPKARGRFKEFGAMTRSATVWKAHVFTQDSHSSGMEVSLNRNKRSSVRKGNWPLLRNLPHNKDKYSRNQKKLGLYDIATDLYALNKESKIDSLENTKHLDSLSERSRARWLQNTVRANKKELPPIDFASRRRYSTHWVPRKSIPSHPEDHVFNEYSYFQRSATKQSDSNGVGFQSFLQTQETTHPGGPNKAELLKHSFASFEHNKNRATLKKKALPLLQSALAFKHHGNKSA